MNNITTNSEDPAIARFESYLKVDPDNTHLLIDLGDAYFQTERMDEAIACYEKCISIDKDNSHAQGRLANLLIAQQRYSEAETALQQLLRDEPNDAALLHNLGLTQYAQQQWPEAIATFKQARTAGLGHPSNLAYIVYSLHQGDATEEALEVAQEWLKQAPGTTTEGYIALLEMDHGDTQAAYTRAQRVLEQQADNSDAAAVVGNHCLEQQDINEAARHFEAIVYKQPKNPRGWLGLGLVRLYQQQHADAIACFEKVLNSSPNHPGTLVTLGWAKIAHQDYAGAEATFRQAITADRNFGEAHGGLATALVFLKRPKDAEHEIQLGLRLDKQNFGAIFAKSIALSLKGKTRMGNHLLAQLLQHSPSEGARPLIENIQQFVQHHGLRGPGKEPGSDNKGPSNKK